MSVSETLKNNQAAENLVVRGRKRPKKDANWKKIKRTKLLNEGKSYTSSRGKFVLEKTCSVDFDCKCPRKCPQNLSSPLVLEQFFYSFWNLGDYSKQNAFLRGLIKTSNTVWSRPRDGSGSAKTTVFHYFIRDNSEDIRACKKFFLGILKISWGRLYRCVTKEEALGVLDGRSRHKAINKIDDTGVIAHIKSFPCYQSHYSRKDNVNKKYLNPDLNIRKMYDLYVTKCESEKKEPVKMKYHYHVSLSLIFISNSKLLLKIHVVSVTIFKSTLQLKMTMRKKSN